MAEKERILTDQEKLQELMKAKDYLLQNGTSPEFKKILLKSERDLGHEQATVHGAPNPKITFKDNRPGHENDKLG